MDPTTIRLPADTLAALDSEYSDYGYSTRADYIRAIIEHRDPPYADTPTTSDYERPTTADYERLRERVAALEETVEAMRDDRDSEPSGDVVAFVKANGPVSRSDIVTAFKDEWQARGIKGDSWWRRTARPQLDESPAEYTRNRGWDFPR